MNSANALKIWQSLIAHSNKTGSTTISDLFATDKKRFSTFSWSHQGLLLDLSKNRLDRIALNHLLDLARAAEVENIRDDMFAGRPINTTEGRRVLHVALRDRSKAADQSVALEVSQVLERLMACTNALRGGRTFGVTGQPISTIISIGIGGSHLGPLLVTEALKDEAGPRIHFAANLDGHDLANAIAESNPETTQVLIASKSFTTEETLTNTISATAWLTDKLGPNAPTKHLIALTANPEAATALGIPDENIFPIWDWVGGRFSLWSAVGLPAAIAIGWQAFSELLDGAHEMDLHFQTAPLGENLPVLLALAGIWNINFEALGSLAVIPYDQRLATLPNFLQQLDMESNGKSVSIGGESLKLAPAPVVFGVPGTNAQHSFHQWLHQGPRNAATEFIGVARPNHFLPGHHDKLITNMLAQSEALAMGTNSMDDPHRACPGNRPSTTIFLNTLDPKRLGMLIALYEHKIFVQGAIWGLNSFDQFGVELGKRLATSLRADLASKDASSSKLNSSTGGLLSYYQHWRDQTK